MRGVIRRLVGNARLVLHLLLVLVLEKRRVIRLLLVVVMMMTMGCRWWLLLVMKLLLLLEQGVVLLGVRLVRLLFLHLHLLLDARDLIAHTHGVRLHLLAHFEGLTGGF